MSNYLDIRYLLGQCKENLLSMLGELNDLDGWRIFRFSQGGELVACLQHHPIVLLCWQTLLPACSSGKIS